MTAASFARALLALALAFALDGAAAQPEAAERPLAALPYTPGLDPAAMDAGANPCEDFYQYACGGWLKAHPIPDDQARWDVSMQLEQENRRFLWGILDRLAHPSEDRSPAQQQIGDHFAACMDEVAIQARGLRPLAPLLAPIAALSSKANLPSLLALLHRSTGSDGLLFSFGANPDYGDASRVIAFAGAGGLGLPDRDYYLKDDEKSAALRVAYRAHVARSLQLLGEPAAQAEAEAGVVMEIETALARASQSRVEQRDPRQQFHAVDPRGLQALTPAFRWADYLDGLGLSGTRRFNVTEPTFLRAMNAEIARRRLADLQAYLRWHVVHASGHLLGSDFVDEEFRFYGTTLHGVPRLSPRWQRCVALVDEQLGDALGQEYVRVAFSPELKQRTQQMTQQIEDAMAAEIRGLDWMGPATKRRALEKLHAIVNKIGYPDRWRDYAGLEIRRDDFFGNALRATRFEQHRQIARIGKPLDRGEWQMTPPTVNAYYDAQMNDINFPAGVLQPPLFDPRMDDAPNYGNTGSTIGHELTHGFDDEGRQFDAHGNLRNWWARKDAAAFERRAQCVVDQYANYIVVDDIHVNSKLTLGEDIADLGGLVLALAAWQAQQAAHPSPPRDGFTPLQRFFIGNAQWACENARPQEQRANAISDSHSPPKYRVNGLVANFREFEQAFHCKPGQPMAPLRRCRVW